MSLPGTRRAIWALRKGKEVVGRFALPSASYAAVSEDAKRPPASMSSLAQAWPGPLRFRRTSSLVPFGRYGMT